MSGTIDVRVVDGDLEGWDLLLSDFEHDSYHQLAYFQLEARRLGGRPVAVCVTKDGKGLLLPLLVRRIWPEMPLFDATSPYGYAGPLFKGGGHEDASFVRLALVHVLDALKSIGVCCAFVRLHPLLPYPEDIPGESGVACIHGQTVWINTDQDERLSWRGVRSSDKNRINKARRTVTSEIDDEWAALPEFMTLYAGTMDRVEAVSEYYFDADYFRAIKSQLGAASMLCVVRHDEEVISAGIFLRRGTLLQFHLSGSNTSLSQLSPARVMIDHMRRWATANGISKFHLGGGLGAAQDSLFEFKAGFSPLRATFRTWRLISSPELYSMACAEAERRGGGSLTGVTMFPPYRFVENTGTD